RFRRTLNHADFEGTVLAMGFILQPIQVVNHQVSMIDGYDAFRFQSAQHPVDAFPGRADQMSQLLVGESEGNPDTAVGLLPVAVGEADQNRTEVAALSVEDDIAKDRLHD